MSKSSITPQDIQNLRQQTGVGMMEAKKALTEANGDPKQALENLRKAGQKIAASKSARQAKEGAIGAWISPDRKSGALLALACETDFVALTPEYRALAEQLAAHLGSLKQPAMTVEQFLKQPGPDGAVTVQQFLENVIGQLRENIQIPAIAGLATSAGSIDSYLHASRKVATLVAIDGGNETVSHDLAMHIAALNPAYLSPDSIPAEVTTSEENIYREQLSREGKPEAMLDKIIPGKLKKFYADVCLLNQPFIKDDSLSIADYLKQNGGASVENFIRVAI